MSSRRFVGLIVAVMLLGGLRATPTLHAQTASACPPTSGTWAPPSTTFGNQVECRRGTTPAPFGYLQYLPTGYSASTRYPLVLFLHGNGERGNGTTGLVEVDDHGPPKLIANGRDFNAVVISPQLHDYSKNWMTSVISVSLLVDYLLATYPIDPDRVYVTGLSLGGGGAWHYAKSRPQVVAAVVPVCGQAASTTDYSILRGKPIWAFHRNGDTVVPISATTNRLKSTTGVDPVPVQQGSTAYFNGVSWVWRSGQNRPVNAAERQIFTVYTQNATGDSHDAWTAAYDNQAMWDWLFLQRRPTSAAFNQDFESSTSVSSYVNATAPSRRQVNDISAEATGGSWSINAGRLQLVRTGSAATDNDAGITRHTNFAGAGNQLHVAFDLGVSSWTVNTSQSGAMTLSIGNFTGVSDYGNGEVAADTFQTISVKGEGAGSFVVMAGAIKSAVLPTNGTMQHVDLFLNKSTSSTIYRAPSGLQDTLPAGGFALWVNRTLVVETQATNGSSSTLTDLRIRFTAADDANWLLDNVVIRTALPQ